MKRLIFAGIIILAVFFRLYNLGQVPPSPSLDEVSIGYNAYSILHTGKDEYGTWFPMLLRAYDDFRPALYVYLTVPFIWILGLTSVAVRLPSVILSVLTIYATYLTGRLLGRKYLAFERLGEIAAILVAISPWHIYISRLGHEVNLGATLVSYGVYFFLHAATEGKKFSWILSALMFALSAHGYQSEKIISPLIVFSGAVAFRKELWKMRGHVISAVIIGLLIALPAFFATISPEGLLRFRGTSAFSGDSPKAVRAMERYIQAKESGNRIGQIINGRIATGVSIVIENYFSHFSPAWLFSGGAREAHKVPGMGLLYIWEAPLILLGLWALVRSKIPKNISALIILCILLSPLPAAFTTQSPHAMRAYTAVPFLQLLEALGCWWIVRRRNQKQLHIIAVVIGMVVAQGVSVFWRGYFVRFPAEQSDSFQYAMKTAVDYANKEASGYKTVEFSNQGNLYQSYMFFLYYSKFNPVLYQSIGGTVSGGFSQAHRIGNYAFGILPQEAVKFTAGTLYFYDAAHVPQGLRLLETFVNLDNNPAIVAVTL